MDYCSRTFGTSPCLATGEPCYNTRHTCKFTSAYNKTTKEYKFCLKGRPLPIAGEEIRPYLIKDPDYLATELDPKNALTRNARITLEFADEPDGDVGIDPYLSQRSSVQGTFWKKFIARNRFYNGRPVLIKKGFAGMVESAYDTQKYIIDQIEGPNKGVIKFILKDLLKRADRVQVPKATAGKVTDNPLTSGATTINCDTTAEYPSSGYVRIKDEIIAYSGKTSTSFTGCTRAQWGTTADQHNVDTKIQLCFSKSAVNGVTIIRDILEDEIGILTAEIDTDGFDAAIAGFCSPFTFTGIVSKPTKASDLLRELCEIMTGNLWWSEEEQLVKFKVFGPPEPGVTPAEWFDSDSLIDASVDNNEESRVSRCCVYYNKFHAKEDGKPESYAGLYVNWDVDAEGGNMYNEKAITTLYTRWTSDPLIARRCAQNYLRRYKLAPRKLNTVVEVKNGQPVQVGDFVNVQTSRVLHIDGREKYISYQVIKKQQKTSGKYAFTLLDTSIVMRYGFICDNGFPDYDTASEAQRAHCYIGRAADNMVYDGTEYVDGYNIW